MPLGALLGGIGGIMGGNKAANAAMDAAGALVGAAGVAGAARVGAADAMRAIDSRTLQQILAANRASGVEAGNAYRDIRNQNTGAYRSALTRLNPLVDQGTAARNAMMYEVGLGDMPEGYSGFQGSPGFNFLVNQGEDAVRNQAAARGSLASGATLKALTDYRMGVASQDFGNHYNRLGGLAGSGDQARYALVGERNRLAAGNNAARAGLSDIRRGLTANSNAARAGSLGNQMNALGMRGEALATRATDAANAYASGRMGAVQGQTQAMQSAFGIPGGMISEGLQLAGGLASMGGFNGIGNALMNGTSSFQNPTGYNWFGG